jgi:hypothetical protein
VASKVQERQRFIRFYKAQTGKTDVDMHEVAKYAHDHGWKLPKPREPIDRLAAQFAAAARVEYRYDKATGEPYRANHAIPGPQPNERGQYPMFWIDIDDETTTRPKMIKTITCRREQMVGDGLQLTRDAEHWNRIHVDQEPLQVPLDFTDDIAWRKNAAGEKAS